MRSVVPELPLVGSILVSPSSLKIVAVMTAVTGPAGGGTGCGAGSGSGPGSDADVSVAGAAVGGLTNSSSAEDFALSVLSVLLTNVARAIDGAATAAIGMISIANESRQATNTLRLPGVGSRDDCFTVYLFL